MKRKAHPLWSAERQDNGKITVNRSVAEREDLEEVEYTKAVPAAFIFVRSRRLFVWRVVGVL